MNEVEKFSRNVQTRNTGVNRFFDIFQVAPVFHRRRPKLLELEHVHTRLQSSSTTKDIVQKWIFIAWELCCSSSSSPSIQKWKNIHVLKIYEKELYHKSLEIFGQNRLVIEYISW